MRRSLVGQFKVRNVEEEQWDLEWRESASREKTRYRTRLMEKCSRGNGSLWLVDFNK
jgi:hypothetical protein